MRRMGGLRKLLPITYGTFIVGWLAIAGVPPFSGFWSKDEILVYAWNSSVALWVVGSIAAVLTAFYMSRQVFLVFFGEPRWHEAPVPAGAAEVDEQGEVAAAEQPTETAADHAAAGGADSDAHDPHERHGLAPGEEPHESPWTMWAPLVVLALAAAVGGALNLPFTKDLHFLEKFLEPSLFGNEAELVGGGATKWAIGLISVALALVGIAAAVVVYLQHRVDPRVVERRELAAGWWIDSGITAFMGGPGRVFFDRVAVFDRSVVDGAVNGVATLVRGGGERLRVLQTGYVRTYALAIAIGAVAVGAYFLTRATF